MQSDVKMFVLELPTLKKIGIINAYSMTRYTKYYHKIGSFELTCIINKDNTELLKEERVLLIETGVAGIIKYIQKESDNNNTMQVRGNLIADILSLRTLYPTFRIYDFPENVLYSIVNEYCKTGARNFGTLTMGENEVTNTSKIQYQKTGSSVADEAEIICTTYDFGYDVEPVLQDIDETGETIREYRFKIYKGKDRTLGNGKNKAVILSTDFNSLISSGYTVDLSQARNYAIVAGEGEGEERKYTAVFAEETEPTGFNRKEVFIDARDIQQNSEATFSAEEEYIELLKQRGIEKLNGDYKKLVSYSAEIRNDDKATYKYGIDFFLGDKVTVIDSTLNLRINTIITGITVTNYEKGYTIDPIFGYETPTLYEKLKKGVI